MVEPSVHPPKAGLDLADVVRRFGPKYIAIYGKRMMPSQKRALADIAACCTPALGGRRYHCEDCHESFWHYHACRNRACPKCHGTQTREWLQQRQAELLPCDYFHAVATVPSELRAVFLKHQKLMYGLLMQVSAEAIKELCARKRHLGALPGILSVLHTWNGRLGYHPHCHMLITGGGITSDGQYWEPARGNFLVPVALLSRRIAAKFRDALKAKAPATFAEIPPKVWKEEWVTFAKHYGQGNELVLNYLSRYVFRTAISNARLRAIDETHVTFRWKDHDTGGWRIERLPGVEFLRRFLQHVLPQGFHKVRYYGLWHPSKRKQSHRAWLLLILETPETAPPPKLSDLLKTLIEPTNATDPANSEATEGDSPRCPHCGSNRTRLIGESHRSGVP